MAPLADDHDLSLHYLMTALATALLRLQLAQRYHARGQQEMVDRDLVEIEREIKRVITLVHERTGRGDPQL